MEKSIRKNLLLALVFFTEFLCLVETSEAATVFFRADGGQINPGQIFTVDVLVDAGNEDLNAFEGKILFPQDLKLESINDGDSIINFWAKKPRVLENALNGKKIIEFSGITPGGFSGALGPFQGTHPGKIFSFSLSSRSSGSFEIQAKDFNFLLNDGQGSPANLTVAPLKISITGDMSASSSMTRVNRSLSIPETFTPQIASDPTVWDGRYFLVFNTEDKETGIDRYEVAETKKENSDKIWNPAESPYLLKDQSLSSYVFVKAVNKAGNERIEELKPSAPSHGYFIGIISGIIILIGALALFLWKTLIK
ncbi:MAG: hypothetical protein ABSE68_02085 [Minisyncoccia bacterium]